MVTYDSKKRDRIRTVLEDCIEDLEDRMERVRGYKTLSQTEKARVFKVILRAKKALLAGHNELLAEFLPTNAAEE